ncbi:MAG: aminopeptidase [Oligoflexus sp.]
MSLQKILILTGMQLLLTSCYSLSQAFQFNDLYNSRVEVSEVLRQDSLPEPIRRQLLWSREIMDFAEAEGLDVHGAYRYYIHTEQPAVSFLVQAAHDDRLEWVTWWFPIIGRVPYLGFFDRNERDTRAKKLADKGYDVATGQVGAFSSLGWFEDPIYRPMLLRPAEELAHLLFHELIHRSFWVPGQVEFNENLAEFAAMILTERFLLARAMQERLKTYQDRRLDREDYRLWLKSLRASLQKVYENSSLLRDEKLNAKEKIFQEYTTEKLPEFRTAGYGFVKTKQWNNAYVLGASLYAPDFSRFEKAFRCLREPIIGSFLEELKNSLSKGRKPFVALDRLCQ